MHACFVVVPRQPDVVAAAVTFLHADPLKYLACVASTLWRIVSWLLGCCSLLRFTVTVILSSREIFGDFSFNIYFG